MDRNNLSRYVCDEIINRKKKVSHRCLIVGVEGQSCSGKSILSNELKNYLISEGYEVEVVSIDDFCNPRKIRYSNEIIEGEQVYYNNFDYEKFKNKILKQCRETGSINFNEFVLEPIKDEYSKNLNVNLNAEGILIIEGIFIFKNEFKKYYDYSIALEIDKSEQLKRAVVRDSSEDGSKDIILSKYYNRYLPSYELYERIDNPIKFVDLIIENTDYLNPKLITKQ